ncbi:MAG TPA: hypothetical protein VF896_16730, partial [Anaerolineales bacterium]
MAPLPTPCPPPNTTEVRHIWGRCPEDGGGGKNNAPIIGALGVPSEIEPVLFHLTITNAPLPDRDEHSHYW